MVFFFFFFFFPFFYFYRNCSMAWYSEKYSINQNNDILIIRFINLRSWFFFFFLFSWKGLILVVCTLFRQEWLPWEVCPFFIIKFKRWINHLIIWSCNLEQPWTKNTFAYDISYIYIYICIFCTLFPWILSVASFCLHFLKGIFFASLSVTQ